MFGKVIGLKSLLSYEGNSVQELEADFQNVIDDYLNDCNDWGNTARKPIQGNL